MFPEDHALSLGVLGIGGHPVRAQHTSTAASTSSSRSARASATWRPTASRRSCKARARSCTSTSTRARSARATSRRTRLSRRRPSCSAGSPSASTHAAHATRCREVVGGVEASTARVVDEVRSHRIARRDPRRPKQLLPSDTIFTIDSGTHFLFAVQYLETVQPDSFIVMTGLGSMGQSIGAAIGAQLAQPDAHGRCDLRRRLLRDERVRDRDGGRRALAAARFSCSTTAGSAWSRTAMRTSTGAGRPTRRRSTSWPSRKGLERRRADRRRRSARAIARAVARRTRASGGRGDDRSRGRRWRRRIASRR